MCCKENKCFAAFVLVGIYAPTRILLYIEGYSFGKTTKEGGFMVIKIDFQSEEALYMQLRNQIIDNRRCLSDGRNLCSACSHCKRRNSA